VPGPRRISQVAAFIGTFAVLLYYALRGGSYDIVARQEEAIAVWWAVGLGWAAGVFPRYRRPRGARTPLIALAGLVVWTALSLSWTGSDARTLAEVARVLHYLGLIVLVWSLFGVDTWRAAGAGLVAGAIAVSLLTIGSRLVPGAFPENTIKGVFETNRLNYPFHYWNAVSAWCAMTIAMALAVSAHAQRLWVRALCLAAVPVCALAAYLTYSRQSIIGVAAAVVVVVALGRNRWTVVVNALAAGAGAALAIAVARKQPAIVDATSGHGAGKVALALAAAAAVAALVAFLGRPVRLDRLRVPHRPAQALVAGSVVLVALVAATAGRHTLSTGWDQFRNKATISTSSTDPAARLGNLNGGRYDHWRVAWNAWEDHPVGGVGAGTFEFPWNAHGDGGFIRDAHSLYFESLAELGIVGFGLVLAFLVGMLYVALRRRRHVDETAEIGIHVALTAAFVVFMVHAAVDWVWETTAISALAFAGVALAGTRRRRYRPPGRVSRGVSEIEKRKRERVQLYRVGRYAIPALALAAILVQLPNLTSTSLMRGSQAAYRDGDIASALSRADDAVHAAPWAADPYLQRGVIFEAQDQLDAAAADMRAAAKREPLNWRPQLLLSRIEAERGNTKAALAAFRAAKRLRPKSLWILPS
jgi:hypothetical protein